MKNEYNITMSLSFGTARKEYRCFSTYLRINKIPNQDVAVVFGPDQPEHFAVPRSSWHTQFNTQQGGCDVRVFQSKTGRKNQSGSPLQYMSKKFEYAIPHRADISAYGTDMSRLSRYENKLLQICGQQNKRGDTIIRITRLNIQSETARCQTTRTIGQNNEVKKPSKVLPHITFTKNDLHNSYYVNLIKFSTKNNTIGLAVAKKPIGREALRLRQKLNAYFVSQPITLELQAGFLFPPSWPAPIMKG